MTKDLKKIGTEEFPPKENSVITDVLSTDKKIMDNFRIIEGINQSNLQKLSVPILSMLGPEDPAETQKAEAPGNILLLSHCDICEDSGFTSEDPRIVIVKRGRSFLIGSKKMFHGTIKIHVWAGSEEDATQRINEMMKGEELMTENWFLLSVVSGP